MVAHQFYRVEIDLKPMVKSGGMPILSFALLPSIFQSSIPWSYGRNQIPDLLARKGVSMRSWERAVDSTETLFKDRNAALEREKRGLIFSVRVMLVILYLPFIYFCSSLYAPGGFTFANYIRFMLSVMLYLISRSYIGSWAVPRLYIIFDRISSLFEEQWFDQVRNLNDEYEQYGIAVEASTRKINGGGVDIPWTVGLVFAFRMQPSNEEDAARFLAHAPTTDVSDATLWRCTMRVMPEQPLMHRKPEAIGMTADPGGGVDIPWTVGLLFAFRMQPSNREDAARFLAHAPTTDVSDATLWRCTMRVMPEQPLMHLKPEALGMTADPGGNYAMALVVGNGDDDWNTEEVSEKKTLLEVV